MLAIVNGGPSDLWVQKHSPGVCDSIIIGVKIHGNGVCLSLQSRRLLMAWEVHFFLLILCFTSTQLSDGFFLISYWRKAQVDLSKHIPLRSHIYHIVTGVKQTVLEAMAI